MSKIRVNFIHDVSNARVAQRATFWGETTKTKARFLHVLLLFAIVFIAPSVWSQAENFRPAELRRQATQLLVQHGYLDNIKIIAVDFTTVSMRMRSRYDVGSPVRESAVFPFKDMPLDITGSFFDMYRVNVGSTRLAVGGSYRAEAEQLVTVLRRLKMESAKASDSAAEAVFSDVASRYRAADPKPDFPEEARRLRVQAEVMLREKRFLDAADYYGEALIAAPWWPEGRFNRALVLGELRDYGDAVREMKRYLQLVPNAPNTRAAQDKIYEWEAQAK